MLAFDYCKYLLRSKTKYGIHPPFMYKLINEVVNAPQDSVVTAPIEKLRSKLLADNSKITVIDYGAGSKVNNKNEKAIRLIAKNAAKSKKYAGLLYRLTKYFQPQSMLELGTSLGISTAYQAFGSPNAKFITLEGCPETAKIAQKNIKDLKLHNIQTRTGKFNDTLDQALIDLKKIDYIFFDGNHKKAATLSYFEKCLPYAHDLSVFVFDDIYWSKGMKEAWREIKNHPKVVSTADLFFIGIVFFRPGINNEHFSLRY